MSQAHVRLPPDSTGKRVAHRAHIDINYTNRTVPLKLGDVVTFGVSTTDGVLTKIHIDTDTTGHIYVTLSHDSSQILTVGENILLNGVVVAQISGYIVFYTSESVVVGANNSFNGQYVDNNGAAYIRFSEGSQQFDAFGVSRVSQQNTLGEYIHTFGKLTNQWFESLVGGGSIVHLPNESSVRLQVGTLATDSVQRTTHRYHQYQAGVSQLIEMTVSIGDTGKTNVTRRWGYYDNNDGPFVSLVGTALSFVVRGSMSGTPVDIQVSRSLWNGDKVDGTGLSGMVLDISKLNIWWIDLQWLGAGRVRFGVYSEFGERITCHTTQNANKNPTVYMRTATLPIRSEMFNTGISASTSEMRLCCAVVKTEGLLTGKNDKWHNMHVVEVVKTGIGAAYVPLVSVRSSLLLNSIVNRTDSLLESITAYVKTSAVRITVISNPTLTGATWGATHMSIDIDTAATSYTGGHAFISMDFGIGANHNDIEKHFSTIGEALRLRADGAYGNTYTLAIKSMETTSDISLTLGWYDTQVA